ncbi:hypothetical protein WOLCODRAFT_141769, partial [Wolfiporia cocos MD-104 SS10]
MLGLLQMKASVMSPERKRRNVLLSRKWSNLQQRSPTPSCDWRSELTSGQSIPQEIFDLPSPSGSSMNTSLEASSTGIDQAAPMAVLPAVDSALSLPSAGSGASVLRSLLSVPLDPVTQPVLHTIRASVSPEVHRYRTRENLRTPTKVSVQPIKPRQQSPIIRDSLSVTSKAGGTEAMQDRSDCPASKVQAVKSFSSFSSRDSSLRSLASGSATNRRPELRITHTH